MVQNGAIASDWLHFHLILAKKWLVTPIVNLVVGCRAADWGGEAFLPMAPVASPLLSPHHVRKLIQMFMG